MSSETASETLFETDRLRVRRLGASDVDAMVRVYGDRETVRWVGDATPLDRAQCEEWVEVTERNYAARGYGMSAIELRATGETVGFCGIVHPGGRPEPEIKYAFEREFWGRGFASEIVPAMLAYGARAHGLGEIIATVAAENLASKRVLGKAGMRFRESRPEDDGSTTDVFVWRAASTEPADGRGDA